MAELEDFQCIIPTVIGVSDRPPNLTQTICQRHLFLAIPKTIYVLSNCCHSSHQNLVHIPLCSFHVMHRGTPKLRGDTVMIWLSSYPSDICQLLIISERLSFGTIFQIIHLPSHPNTLIHDTTQNVTSSLSCDQTLLSLNSLIGCSNCSMAILGLCAITIPIFPRGIFCWGNPPPLLEFTR